MMLFRLLGVLLSGLLRPRLRLGDEGVLTLRVWPNDLDGNLHMNNSRYLLAMDLGRWDLVARSRLGRELLRHRWWPVLGSATLRFRRGLSPFQRFRIVTRFLAWDEKWCWLEQRFEADGQLCAVGRVKALFRGRAGNVPMAEVLAACGEAGTPSPPLPDSVRLWQEADEAERAGR
jgi:acyl-CoA thioesterase FadM